MSSSTFEVHWKKLKPTKGDSALREKLEGIYFWIFGFILELQTGRAMREKQPARAALWMSFSK